MGGNLRTIELDGEPWFVAADVCRILGLAVWKGKAKTGSACKNLGPDEKGVARIDTLGGPQRLTIVSESGLYKLIMRSDKDTARPFQDWVKR